MTVTDAISPFLKLNQPTSLCLWWRVVSFTIILHLRISIMTMVLIFVGVGLGAISFLFVYNEKMFIIGNGNIEFLILYKRGCGKCMLMKQQSNNNKKPQIYLKGK